MVPNLNEILGEMHCSFTLKSVLPKEGMILKYKKLDNFLLPLDLTMFIFFQFFTLDAIILGTYAAKWNTWKKLLMISSFDYQSIVVPLLKSFMQVCVLSSGLFY